MEEIRSGRLHKQRKQEDLKERDHLRASNTRLMRNDDHYRNGSRDFRNYKKDVRHDRGIRDVNIHHHREDLTSSKERRGYKRPSELSDYNNDRIVKRSARERDYSHLKDSLNYDTGVSSSGRYRNSLRSGRF